MQLIDWRKVFNELLIDFSLAWANDDDDDDGLQRN